MNRYLWEGFILFCVFAKRQCRGPVTFWKGRNRRGNLWYRLKESHLKWGWLTQDGSTQPASNEKKWKEREKLIGCIESFYFAASQGIGWGAWSDWVSGRNVFREAHLTADILKHTHMNCSKNSSVKSCGQSLEVSRSCSFDFLMYLVKSRN